jgi:hypothetical protein
MVGWRRALGGALLSNFYNRFEEQIAELSPAARLAQVV